MKRTIIAIGACGLALLMSAQSAGVLPYQNPALTFEERADDLLSRLTLEEKASLMMDASPAIPRLGIPQWHWWSEALHGVGRNGTATVYPITMQMASTFDDGLVERIFSAVSDEGRAKNTEARRLGKPERNQCLSFWTPNINIFRDPRWGRGQETYGEDPYLTARMGTAVVRGLQGPDSTKYRKAYACAKHYAVHSGPEWNRHTFNVNDISDRDLWETYLPAFEALVKEAGVREVMCAYQRYNDRPCCGSDELLRRILRDKWGYRHLVVSDCGAISDFLPGKHGTSADPQAAAADAVLTGTDLECGGEYRHIPEAVKRGDLDEADVDRALRRLLIGRMELGDFDPDSIVPWTSIPSSVIASFPHKMLALEAARKGAVLLQNDGLLPLGNGVRVALLGPAADDSVAMWGNYNGFPTHTVTLREAFANRLGANLYYAKGVDYVKPLEGPDADVDMGRVMDADVVVFAGGITPALEGEEMPVDLPGFYRGDRQTIELPAVQRDFIRKLHEAGKKIVMVNSSGSAVALTPESEACGALIQGWYGGELGGEAIAEIIFGEVNPSGKLPVTFYRSDADLPDFEDYGMRGRTYRYFQGDALYPFGHGLSYTAFSIGKPSWRDGKVTVEVANTGDRAGEEVVQVYLRRDGDIAGPAKSLRAFKRVSLLPGEKKLVSLDMPRSRFETWDPDTRSMRVIPGTYTVMAGPSSASLRSTTVKIK
ncbi:glycoside hydrolase family 3 C-terminal domain-containing protein [uncultured Muribaculum sp.]|uniref:glycoside hydrolase family 3 C-terminal domain-containing protein n=1 Tax=uncultured Muribaculum sp. TaxID=1918613 RepID=UPI0025DBD599|nr:glycoside hydrolase family 3 C-terminal domain-containing protein [uncultured Muribaculum sp.]